MDSFPLRRCVAQLMLHAPPASGSRIAAKIDALSNRGQASQSSEPSREISAAERPLPMTA
jgi:hypothetical protein